MFKTRRRVAVVRALTALTVLLAVFSMWGCSDLPVAPTAQNGPHLLTRSASSSVPMAAGVLYTDAEISSRTGGRLELYGVTLDVPPFAVAQDTLYSITIPDAGVFFCSFGTSGLVFNQPVKVTISFSDADLTAVDESTLRFAYLNEATGQWESLPCVVDHVNKVVVAYMQHFSAYGLISD